MSRSGLASRLGRAIHDMMTSMLGRSSKSGVLALACASTVWLAASACAEGTVDDPTATRGAFSDAGSVEAAVILPPSDVGTVNDGGNGDEDSGTKDGGGAVTAACQSALAKANFDFEGSDQGWTHRVSDNANSSATWPFDPWSRGAATKIQCPNGTCWAAERLQNYAQCQRGELVSPSIDVKACAGVHVVLAFKHAYAFWTGSFGGSTWFDGGIVEISKDDGATWEVPTGTYPGTVKINPSRGSGYDCVLGNQFHVHGKSGFVGTQTAPSTIEVDIPASALTETLRIRFSQASGVSSSTASADTSRLSTAAGWRIDDVQLLAK